MTTSEQNESTNGTESTPDVAELQANIEQTRQDLGETVDALTAKLDVKSRTKARLNDTKDRATVKLQGAQAKATEVTASARQSATDDAGKPKPEVLAGAAGLVTVIVAAISLVIWRKRR